MKRLGTLAVVVMSLLVGCGGETATDPDSRDSEPDTFTVSGTLLLESYDGVDYAGRGRAGEECWGYDGYGDIGEGAAVVVRDPDGKRVGLGTLDAGRVAHSVERYEDIPCEFAFTVSDVPSGQGIYSVEVANRGEVSFKREQADAVRLTLGS